MKPLLNERFCDDGSHSHWELLNSEGEIIWTEFLDTDKHIQTPEREQGAGQPDEISYGLICGGWSTAKGRIEIKKYAESHTRQALDQERKKTHKLVQSASKLVRFHMYEQEGIASGTPTPKEWTRAVDDVAEALSEMRTDKES